MDQNLFHIMKCLICCVYMGCFIFMGWNVYVMKFWAKKCPTYKLAQLINVPWMKSQCPCQQTHHHEHNVIIHVISHVGIHITIHVNWLINLCWILWRLFLSQTLGLGWAVRAQRQSVTFFGFDNDELIFVTRTSQNAKHNENNHFCDINRTSPEVKSLVVSLGY